MAKNQSVRNKNRSANSIMEKLLASLPRKSLFLERGEEVLGQVVALADKEVILDLATKAEGILPLKELPLKKPNELKIGDKITCFVVEPENESGQVLLSSHKVIRDKSFPKAKFNPSWDRFIQAKQQNSIVSGRIVDSNKGGLIVESQGIRGFLPSSQIGAGALTGDDIKVFVSEVAQANNKLIFSQKGMANEESLSKISNFSLGQTLEGQVLKVFPFGLNLAVVGVVGMVSISEIAWEKVDSLDMLFKVGDKVTAIVSGIDQDFGRLNLSLKKATTDPFIAMAQKFRPDDIVKGKIAEVTSFGVRVLLEEGIEGFIPAAKLEGQDYTADQEVTFLVDSIDHSKRRINLAPFITTTKGLIYK